MRSSQPLPTRFDAYEISGLAEFIVDGSTFCEPVADEEATFWSLYGHAPGEGAICIGDFATRADAEEVYARITGQPWP
jgi:hypothetical protein